ncbi:MAG: hypothetical protein AAGH88_08980 [Planctomycetota bacterium]
MTRILRVPRQTVRLEDVLADHEPWYRSRGEAKIGRLLDRYGIPFAYEQPLNLDGGERSKRYLPDFTLLPYDDGSKPEPATRVIEYLGMLDRTDYRRSTIRKMRDYAAHGVHALYIRPHELRDHDWSTRLVDRVTHHYQRRQNPNPYRYNTRQSYLCRRTKGYQ